MKIKAHDSSFISPTSELALPSQLAVSTAQAVRELLEEAAAANTTRSYATALRYWPSWSGIRFGREFTLPLTEAEVMQFVVDHVARRGKNGLMTWELPAELDEALVARGRRPAQGPGNYPASITASPCSRQRID